MSDLLPLAAPPVHGLDPPTTRDVGGASRTSRLYAGTLLLTRPSRLLKSVARGIRRGWSLGLAASRLSPRAVCRESIGLGEYDYHSHRDDTAGAPWFVEGGRRCGRCGKRFRV